MILYHTYHTGIQLGQISKNTLNKTFTTLKHTLLLKYSGIRPCQIPEHYFYLITQVDFYLYQYVSIWPFQIPSTIYYPATQGRFSFIPVPRYSAMLNTQALPIASHKSLIHPSKSLFKYSALTTQDSLEPQCIGIQPCRIPSTPIVVLFRETLRIVFGYSTQLNT